MVYYSGPKRGRRAQQTSGNASFSSLSSELQLQIAESLDDDDLLSIRLVCQTWTPIGASMIVKLRNHLYISPRTLQTALEICTHPLFGQAIETITLLDHTNWADVETANGQSLHVRYMDESSYPKAVRSLVCPWTVIVPHMASVTSREAVSRDDTREGPFLAADLVTLLLKTLARMPKLKGFRLLAESSTETGFNARARRRYEPVGDIKDRISTSSLFTRLLLSRQSTTSLELGAEVLCIGTLSQLKPELQICTASYLGPLVQRQAREPLNEIAVQSLSNVVSLRMHFDCGWNKQPTPWHHYCDGLLRYTKALQSLHLDFKVNRAIKRASQNEEIVLKYLLEGRTLPSLHKLELGLQCKTASSDACSSMLERPERPSCQNFDICGFLERHHTTLTTIKISNVIFISDGQGAFPTTLKAIELLKQFEELASVEWTVAAYRHDPRCTCEDGDAMVACKMQCGQFHWKGHDSTPDNSLDQFELLAQMVGIELEEGRKAWDFGKAVIQVG